QTLHVIVPYFKNASAHGALGLFPPQARPLSVKDNYARDAQLPTAANLTMPTSEVMSRETLHGGRRSSRGDADGQLGA
ncbi:hypothetical protein, partial [Paraburkholderia tropica]|uniref:hypothetical protein n=1 Tax=Paraburkholderia tropica TaxID=92647 RepID=UPI001C8F7F97